MSSQRERWSLLLVSGILLSIVLFRLEVYAVPQTADFVYHGGFWYDSWGYTRDYALGSQGFMPNLAYEALGEWRSIAFAWGTTFIDTYPDRIQRANAILAFVQQWTEYGYDEDNVVIGGRHQEEWAWNGDDMAGGIDLDTSSVAIGDCEDLAFLCAAIYAGAGFDTAMVLTTEHAALLIWLPEYPEGLKWDITSDGRGYGWIWVEATGEHNPLGWTPDPYRDGDWEAFVVELLYIHNVQWSPQVPQMDEEVMVTTSLHHTVSPINAVKLRYFLEGTPYVVEMQPIGSMRYRAGIPAQVDGVRVDFEIVATDELGSQRISDRLSYQVGTGGFTFPPILVNAGLLLIVLVAMIMLFSAL